MWGCGVGGGRWVLDVGIFAGGTLRVLDPGDSGGGSRWNLAMAMSVDFGYGNVSFWGQCSPRRLY